MRVPTHTAPLPGMSQARHQPRRVQLVVDALPGGRLRVSTPHARGWAVVARGPDQLARAVATAFTETAVAAYSAWKAQRYDLDRLTAKDDPTEPAPRPVHQPRPLTAAGVSYGSGRVVRPDQASPAHWTPLPDGAWQSPAGRRYTNPRIVNGVVAARAKLGLPITHQDQDTA